MVLNKYTGKDNERIRIIADAILIFSLIGRLENQASEITGFKASIEKYSYSLFDLADSFSDGLLNDQETSDLSDELLNIFFENNENYDIKNYTEEGSELLAAETIYLKWKHALENIKKKKFPF